MKITVAGESKEVKDGITIAFVQRDTFGTAALKEGDVVEFLYFMGGGR